VTSRDAGTVTLVDAAGTTTEAGPIEGVEYGGEGGLLGVAVSPTFDTDHRLFVYYSTAQDNRIATVELVDGALGNQQVGFTGIAKAGIHNGGRLAFGPDGMLYVGTGDAGDRPSAQDPDALGGKILRLTPDLRPAPGNPTDPRWPAAPATTWATATCRAWRSTTAAGSGPRSSARTPGTS
jgi:glucose/arabinose dehydrogenase